MLSFFGIALCALSVSLEDMQSLKSFLEKHGLKFGSLSLLEEALTHRSYTHESSVISTDNERLEYLGDSVLNLIVSSSLFEHFPHSKEGELTQMRSSLVCEGSLARVARQLSIGKLLRLGKGEEKLGGREKPSILANCLEALIAALYIDQGFSTTRKYVLSWFQQEFKELSHVSHLTRKKKDPKSYLQEMTQKYLHEVPIYEKVSHSGPEHRKEYVVRVLIDGKEYARGKGFSLKTAKQKAALNALYKAEVIKFGTNS